MRQRDNYGQTVLHLACISGNLAVVRELCEQVIYHVHVHICTVYTVMFASPYIG